MRRLALVLLLVLPGVVVVWAGAGLPPPRLLLLHGMPPCGGPTGRTRTEQGLEIVEVRPGYVHVDLHEKGCEPGDPLGTISRPLSLPFGEAPLHGCCPCRFWAECPDVIWISTEPAGGWTGLREDRDPVHPGLRLITASEWHFAFATGAIHMEPEYFECAVGDGEEGVAICLNHDAPGLAFSVINGAMIFRLVWTAPEE